jgi:hypothetical protein
MGRMAVGRLIKNIFSEEYGRGEIEYRNSV